MSVTATAPRPYLKSEELVPGTWCTTFANGCRVMTRKADHVDTITMAITTAAGGLHATNEKAGLGHFCEHMLFRSGKGGTTKEYADKFAAIGYSQNAYTSDDAVMAFCSGLAEYAREGFNILSDIWLYPYFKEDELEIERGIVLEEIFRKEDDPSNKVWEIVDKHLFGDIPAGEAILGSVESVNSITRDDMVTFYNTHYYDGNEVIIYAAGNVDHMEMVHMAIDAGFDDMEPIEDGFVNEFIPGEYPPVIYSDTEQVHAFYGKRFDFDTTLSLDDKLRRDVTLSLIMSILGSGMESRLFRRVRDEEGLAYAISGFYHASRSTPGLVIKFGATPDNSTRILEICDEIINEIIDDGITEQELRNEIVRYKTVVALSSETANQLFNSMANKMNVYNEFVPIERIMEIANSITHADIKQAASLYLSGDWTYVAIEPEEK